MTIHCMKSAAFRFDRTSIVSVGMGYVNTDITTVERFARSLGSILDLIRFLSSSASGSNELWIETIGNEKSHGTEIFG